MPHWGQGEGLPYLHHQLLHPTFAAALSAHGTSGAQAEHTALLPMTDLLGDFCRSVVLAALQLTASHVSVLMQQSEDKPRHLIFLLFSPCIMSDSERTQSVGKTFSLQLHFRS